MTTEFAGQLCAGWRDRAEFLRSVKAEGQATVFEQCAADLEAAARRWNDELLSPDQAAQESGYSTRRLRELVDEGTLPNHGRKGAPLYRRSEIPQKAGRSLSVDAAAERFLERLG